MKIGYFIKEKKEDQNGNFKLHQHKKKIKKTQVAQNQIRKEQISTPQIGTKTRRFQLQELSNSKATGCPQKPAQS